MDLLPSDVVLDDTIAMKWEVVAVFVQVSIEGIWWILVKSHKALDEFVWF